MPEGPEVRRVADRLARELAGRCVEEVAFGLPRLARFADLLVGLVVDAVSTHGKALLIRFGGITNSAARVKALEDLGLPRDDYRFSVFGREGQPCHRCGTTVRRRTAASRRLYWCPTCQAPADDGRRP
ncbi:MAG TPA: DNA-formamidopyrimidine glycosylase family protein [Woeseiaceae bacterium]